MVADTDQRKAAAHRVMDAMERGGRVDIRDVRTAQLCIVCWGHGYYYVGDDGDEQRKTCPQCGGDGLAHNHPNKAK